MLEVVTLCPIAYVQFGLASSPFLWGGGDEICSLRARNRSQEEGAENVIPADVMRKWRNPHLALGPALCYDVYHYARIDSI